jgi:hypothetical protein
MRYRYPREGNGITKDANGRVLDAVTVTAYLAGTTSAAKIYATLTSTTAIYSVTSDDYGAFSFFVDTDDYSTSQLFDIACSKAVGGGITFSTTTSYSVQIMLYSDADIIVTNSGTSTAGNMVSFSSETGKEIEDSGITKAALSSTVSLKHTQGSDAGTSGNTFSIGDGAGATDKHIQANNADVNKPYLGYDEVTNSWVFSNDGVLETAITGAGSVGFATAAEALAGASDTKALSPLTLPVEGYRNLSFTVTKGSNALTITFLGADGNALSASNIGYVKMRSATLTDSNPVVRSVAAPLSLVLTAGSTLGFANSETGRVYVGLIDSDGTGTMKVVVGRTSTVFNEGRVVTTTAEGGAGGADSATVLYSNAAYTSMPAIVLGYFEIQTGSTAGNWSNDATALVMMRPGVKRSGDIAQRLVYKKSNWSEGTGLIPSDNSIPQISEGVAVTFDSTPVITPTSGVNRIYVGGIAHVECDAAAYMCVALFRDSVADAITVGSHFNVAAGHLNHINVPWCTPIIPGSTTQITVSMRVGGHANYTFDINGYGNVYYGGVMTTQIEIIEEVA